MQLQARTTVTLILCCALFLCVGEPRLAAAKDRNPCAALTKLAGTQKDASAAITECIRNGSGEVPPGEYLLAKPVNITRPNASLSTAGVSVDAPRCSSTLACARFQRSAKFRSGAMFSFAGKGSKVRHIVLDGAQERLAAPLQQKGSLLEMKSCRECSLSGAIVQSSIGHTAVAITDSSAEISNTLFFGNGSAAAATDAIFSKDSSFNATNNLFVNNAGLNVRAANCRNQCLISQNVVTYIGPAVPVPAAMLLRGSGYAVFQNYINCSAGGCAQGIVTGTKASALKAAEADTGAQTQGVNRKPTKENLVAGNISVPNGESVSASPAFTSLLPTIVKAISGKDLSSENTLLGELLGEPDVNKVVALRLPYSQYGNCAYDCIRTETTAGPIFAASARGGNSCSREPPFECQMSCCKAEHVGFNKAGTCVAAVYHKPANFPCSEASPVPAPVECPQGENQRCFDSSKKNKESLEALITAIAKKEEESCKGLDYQARLKCLFTNPPPELVDLRDQRDKLCPLGNCCPQDCSATCCKAPSSPAPQPPEKITDPVPSVEPGKEPITVKPVKEDPVVKIPELLPSTSAG